MERKTADKIVNLLIAEESPEFAETHTSFLRDSGMAARDLRINDLEGLEEILPGKSWDLLIAARQHPDLDCGELITLARKEQPDMPVIVIQAEADDKDAFELLSAGATYCVARGQKDLLHLYMKRALEQVRLKRELNHHSLTSLESERRCRTLMDSSRDAIAYIHEGMHIYTNRSYLEMFGIQSSEELEGMPILDLINSDQVGQFKKLLRTLDASFQDEQQHEFALKSKSKGTFKANMKFSPASIEGEPCIQVVIEDQRVNEELVNQIKTLSMKDLVTGLSNRQYFMEITESLLAQENSPGHWLLYLKLDKFNDLKDKLGIAGCDIIMRDIASEISRVFPTALCSARFADDTFTILYQQDNHNKIRPMADILRAAIEDRIFDIEGKSVSSTASVGIIHITPKHRSPQRLLAEAERACNTAQQEGGNRVHSLLALSGDDQTLEKKVRHLRNALSTDKFRLLFQPIVSLHAEPGERYEILLRLLTDKGEEISPTDFLPVAEKAGLMPEIDRWVIKRAIGTLATARRGGKELKFFIKISEESLVDPTLVTWLTTYLKAARLPGDSLVFEVAEEVLGGHINEAKLLSNGLKALRCELAVDHVTGGLDFLKHIEAKYIKIDGSLINKLSSDHESQDATKRITHLAQSRAKLTIAEFVHDPNTLAILWQYGVNFVQGYYLQKPETSMQYDFSGL